MAYEGGFGQRLKDIGGGVVGLLGNEGNQLGNLVQNPAFQMGIGLLDPSQTLSQGVLGGLGRAAEQRRTEEDRKRMEEYRDALKKLIEAQTSAAAGGAPINPATGTPVTPTEQALQMSLMPGMPGSSMNVPGEPTMSPGNLANPLGLGGTATGDLLQQLGMRNFRR